MLGTIEGDNVASSYNNYPIQVQIVASSGQAATLHAGEKVKEDASFLGVMTSIAKAEGYAVLFSGAFERVVRSTPQFGMIYGDFIICTASQS